MKSFLRFLSILSLGVFTACSSSSENPDAKNSRKKNQKGEYVYRQHDEHLFNVPPPEKKHLDPYPWEKELVGKYPKITKEFFRCKGSQLNPPRIVSQNGETVRFYDCGGAEKHSLPLRNSKEFIYPILIDLMNYIQTRTAKRLVITCGHRCPDHNTYADPSTEAQQSKHMIGAEVSFYVQGLEDRPELLVKYIQDYYKEKHKGDKEYEEFQRYSKRDVNVATPPWYNKEVFVKLFTKKEGRNFDNRHPYSYISIQVRFDAELNEKVIYSWEKANRNYLRW